jgi:hypothetical protein
MACDVAVQNSSTIVDDDEEAVEHGESDRRNREEVDRRDGFPMVAQNSEPALGGSGSLEARFIQRETVLWEISRPSMRSSPWMRGAQLGFSATIWKQIPNLFRRAF